MKVSSFNWLSTNQERMNRWETQHECTDLSVQARSHCTDDSGLAVDGEHVGDGTVGGLRQDTVAHHAVGGGGVIGVCGRHLHHGGAWDWDKNKKIWATEEQEVKLTKNSF